MLLDSQSLPWENMSFMLLLCFGFYWLVMRPQQQEETQKKAMINELKVGDEVSTTSGILGKVHSVSEDVIYLSTGQQQTLIIKKQAVEKKLEKGTLKRYKK